ncbi:MAG TPA: hypothetical protein VFR21_14705 [Bradyrhizobium sp.]|jgi:hypothetical protein|nr:hypothetical protein [Bradyrhizobium sp.]
MIYAFRLPTINPHMSAARIECAYAKPGDVLKTGSKLFDLGVDLSSAFAQECPPISFFRVVLREPVILRKLSAVRGQLCEIGELVALFSTQADESLSASPARDIRFVVAGIIHHDGLWTGNTA